MNGMTITEDVSEAIEAFRSGEFKYFGQKIGQTLILATQDSVPENLFLYWNLLSKATLWIKK